MYTMRAPMKEYPNPKKKHAAARNQLLLQITNIVLFNLQNMY